MVFCGRRVWDVPEFVWELVGFYIPRGIGSVPLLVWFFDQIFVLMNSCRGSGNSIAVREKVKYLENVRCIS